MMLPYISKPFELVSGALGASPDELKLIFSFLISYPLAGLLKRVPDARPGYKNVFIVGCSLFYLVGLFDLWSGLRTLFISSAGVYALAHYMRNSPYMPWISFVFLMGHMAVNQLSRQFANMPATVDITGAQMVLVMKLSAFCWNVADGTLPDDQLSDFQKDKRIIKLPNLLDYAGYVLFFPSLLAGPSFDYNEYKRWIDTTMFDLPATVDPSKKPPTRKKRRIPRSGTPAMRKAAAGLMWIFAFIQCSKYFDWEFMISNDFLKYGFLRRVFYLHMMGFTARLKYYGVWSLTEGACILAGLGYKGIDPATGKVSWDRLQNINPWGVETAQNSRAYLENWNMNTNKWLRYYVYLRVTPRGRKPGFRASLATFTTSAFWHGFYPGYYMSFILASFVQTAAKHFRRNLRPFFLNPVTQEPLSTKKYYDIASYVATQATFSFVVAPFVILGLNDAWTIWGRVYFYAIITTGASLLFWSSPGKKWVRGLQEKRTREVGVRMVGNLSAESVTNGGPEKEPIYGLSQDPGQDVNEMVQELRTEVDRAKTGLERRTQHQDRKGETDES